MFSFFPRFGQINEMRTGLNYRREEEQTRRKKLRDLIEQQKRMEEEVSQIEETDIQVRSVPGR